MSDWARQDVVKEGHASNCAWIDMVGWEASSRAQKGLVEVANEWLRSNGHSWAGDKWSGLTGHGEGEIWAVVLEWTWVGGRQAGLVEAGDKWLCLNGHDWVGDGWSGPKRVGRGWDTSGCARKDVVRREASSQAWKGLVDAGDEQLHLNGHGWVGDSWLGLKKPGGGWETSSCARMDTVGLEMGNRAWKELGEGETWAVALERTWLGGRQAAGLKRAWWMRETSSCARMDTVGLEMGNRAWKELGEGGTWVVALELTMLGGRQAARPKITWWRVGAERSGLRGCNGGGTQAVALESTWLGGKQAARNEGA